MTTYRLGPDVRWVVQRQTVTLTDGHGRVRTLEYPEAAVWDLLSRGYAFDKTVLLMTCIAVLDLLSAAGLVRCLVQDLAQGGFLVADPD